MPRKMRLVFECPVPGCPENNKKIYWKHSSCEEEEWIYEYGYIECAKCRTRSPLFEWVFQCANHVSYFSDKWFWNETTFKNFLKNLMNSEYYDDDFKAELIYNLNKMYQDYN